MYLDDLDGVLRGGVSTLSAEMRRRQAGFVWGLQRADGGFAGRLGSSDLYYTDFALRVLTLAGPDEAALGALEREALARTAEFVRRAGAMPRDVVECFSALNAARMLARWGVEAGGGLREGAAESLGAARLASGGFARPGGGAARGGGEASAYHTFLAALCYEMLEEEFPESAGAVAAIAALKRGDGGYADLASGAAGQTNASAAAIALLTMRGALSAPDREVVAFLLARQGADGGFAACDGAPESDLLSTFTALVSLFAMDGMARVDLGGAVRFAGRLAGSEGGFRATNTDLETDIEYTFYGLGALAVVRVYVELIKTFS